MDSDIWAKDIWVDLSGNESSEDLLNVRISQVTWFVLVIASTRALKDVAESFLLRDDR